MSKSERIRDLVYQYIRYGIIAVLIFIALVLLPMFDTDAKLGWEFPETSLGWVSYIVIRGLVGVITYLIFVSFHEQGKVNILKDERYINACEKLRKKRDKKYIPESPKAFELKSYGLKAVTTAITSIVTAFVVINCILSYNYNILLAYAISIILATIRGVFAMMKASLFWTEKFPLWVDYHLEQLEKEEKENV